MRHGLHHGILFGQLWCSGINILNDNMMMKVNVMTFLLDVLSVFIPSESCLYATVQTCHIYHSFSRKAGYYKFIQTLASVFVMMWHIWKDNIKINPNDIGLKMSRESIWLKRGSSG
jgi:hypothetical protein